MTCNEIHCIQHRMFANISGRVNMYTHPQVTKSNQMPAINIMCQFTKLLLKMVMDRMEGNIKAEHDDAQRGFHQL